MATPLGRAGSTLFGGNDDGLATMTPRAKADTNVGLSNNLGGILVRSCLTQTGVSLVDPMARKHGKNTLQDTTNPRYRSLNTVNGPVDGTPRKQDAMLSHTEPRGMWFGLLLNDMSEVSEEDINLVKQHRWSYGGAAELAAQGKSICFFIWCLLELQRNVQVDEEGDVLDPKLIDACKSFVKGQCRDGKMGEMYQVLSHFISNSVVFHEWDRYLKVVFEDPKANQESFMVPHIEQVWRRFCRLKTVLEQIFDVLDERFVWRHRLPKVGELVHEHMKRRCFGSELVSRNELFAGNAARDEKLKQVKFAFGFG
eukprot:TRINITY_DN27675_c0_g1_i1.p1 TRINITY_DN27675_c0_g1~~TRINITY_DN27675_c0_g1_i1.p1  ORF type:complete len:311 (+),score=48.64 TRINITY_DN27675_c0_g1_i1:103-1035(+)